MRTHESLAALALALLASTACRSVPNDPPSVVAMHAAAQPGPPHARLCEAVGEYTTHTLFWERPDAPPVETQGSARLSRAIGGRFVIEESPLEITGRPLSGMRVWGYNNGSGKYEAVWLYDQSTAMMTMHGETSDGGATIRFRAKFDDERGASEEVEIVRREIDANRFVVEVTAVASDGRRLPMLQTTYERRR
jgi:hypothetical protein